MHYLASAMEQITATCGSIAGQSHMYETAAWGLTEQPDFLNMVVRIETSLSPTDVLHAIQIIENTLGRQREIKWGQRTLDIDILFYNMEIISRPNLQIPHPHIQERRFVLAPLADIAPDIVHPVLQQTIAELLATCPDKSDVRQLQPTREI